MATTFTQQNSGYLAAAISVVWSSGQSLNSLTNDEYTDLSDEIDNSSDHYLLADFFITLASAAFSGGDSGIELYLVPCVDGTNYPTWTGNGTADEPENVPFAVGQSPLTGTTAAQASAICRVDLPPGKFKVALRNRGNVSLAASGNAVVFRPYSVAATAP